VVAGSGITAWSAAAALRRRLPWLSVTILPDEPAPDALADLIGSTLPSAIGFHDDLGLSEGDAVVRTRSGLRLGTVFAGWTAQADYVHAYGEHGRPVGAASFHQHWVRAAQAGRATPFDRHSPAAALARAGRFMRPDAQPGALLAGYEFGLHIDPDAYRAMLRAFALHIGVGERRGRIVDVRRRPDGFVAGLALDDGGEVGGDLFVDATGAAARLRGALDERWDDWSRWLPCDRVLLAAGPAPSTPAPLDRVTAHDAGWRWRVDAPRGSSSGVAYASARMDEAAARGLLPADAGEPLLVTVSPGTRPQPWLRNCVAIGDAATRLEPLEWCNLHLAHSAIDRIVAMLPGRDCAPVELAEYNRQCAAEAARVRDFVALHYIASDRSGPFWQAVAAVDPPPTLALTLTQFRERGRLPVHEEETFARDSWLAVLLGQGVLPRRVDPLIATVPLERFERAMADLRVAIDAAVAPVPAYPAFLQSLAQQVAR